MTISIDRATRERAKVPPSNHKPLAAPRDRLICGVRIFAAIAVAAGVALGAWDLAGDGGVHLIMPSVGCFVLASQATTILIVHSLLASHQEFYRRGQLDGWMKGWRGQQPDVDDPLLR
jgi:hypothetical protein